MRSRYRINYPDRPHFVTATIIKWLPVFTSSDCCDVVVRALCFARERKGLRIYGWVIMDNRFHAIVAGERLAQTLGDLKKFTAREILAQLKSEGRGWLLNQLAHYRARYKSQSQHQVWQEGVHPQSIPTDEIMLQKLEYLHHNPVKRGLVATPEHWRYSSAHERLAGGATGDEGR
jgi:REP element-mobilizing transposase RayT